MNPDPIPGLDQRYLGGDVSACSDASCGRATECRRFTGKRSEYRQVSAFYEGGPDGCDSFMPRIEEPSQQL